MLTTTYSLKSSGEFETILADRVLISNGRCKIYEGLKLILEVSASNIELLEILPRMNCATCKPSESEVAA